MLRSFAVVSALTSVVLAQSTSNPLIPTGLSNGCTSFLESFNTNPNIKTCLSALNTATAAFAPGSNTTPSSESINSALTNLCSSSVETACPETAIRAQLANFYTSCTAELSSTPPNSDLLPIYDVLYTLIPMTNSICTKDDEGNWCVSSSETSTRDLGDALNIPGQSSSTTLSQFLSMLYSTNAAALRKRAPVTAVIPNLATFRSSNLPFIFLTPELDATKLCTTCTKKVLSEYMSFESDISYGPGLAQSSLLSTQSPLYAAVTEKCPTLLSAAVQAAGGLAGSKFVPNAAAPSLSKDHGVIALIMGVATLALAI